MEIIRNVLSMKTKFRLTRYLLLIPILAGLPGCEKDTLTLLTDGEWQFRNMITYSSILSVSTYVETRKSVMTNGTLVFNTDGSYILDSPEIDAETGSWVLRGSELILNNRTDRTTSIDDISRDQLVYHETSITLGGEPYTITYYWKK